MATTNFVNNETTVVADWLNDVDAHVYDTYIRSAAEISAGVTPTNTNYPYGDLRRYGAVGDGSTDDTTAINNALEVMRVAGSGEVYGVGGKNYKITAKLVIGSLVTFNGNGCTITQNTNNTPVIEVSGGAGDVQKWAIKNTTLTYSSAQSAANTNSIGVRLSVTGRTNYLGRLESVYVISAYRGFDVPNIANCFAFFISFENCMAYGCSDYGWYIQGDTTAGSCTNFALDACWVVQPAGSEVAGSKGFAFLGVTQLDIGNIATDHTQADHALYLSLCSGRVDSITIESCDYTESSSVHALVHVEGGSVEIGLIACVANNVTISGSADFAVLRLSTSGQVSIGYIRDLNTTVTDTSSGAYHTIYISGSGNSGQVWRYTKNGATPSEVITEPSAISQVVYFNGTDRTVIVGSTTYDPPSLADGAGTTPTISMTGVALGDYVESVSFSLDTQGILLYGWVSAADTVSVRFQNETAGVIDLGSGTLRARVRRNV